MLTIHINKLPVRNSYGCESNFWIVADSFGLKAKRHDRDFGRTTDRERENGITTDSQVAEMLARNQAYLAERGLAPKCYGVVCLVDSSGCHTYTAVTQLARIGRGSASVLEDALEKALAGTGINMARDLHGGNYGVIGRRTVLVDCGAMAFDGGIGIAKLKPKKFSRLTKKMVKAIQAWGA
jgi:hypothetical protein